jgi:hypothetical protein
MKICKMGVWVLYIWHSQASNLVSQEIDKEHKINPVSDISGKYIPKHRKFDSHAKRLPKGMKAKNW